MYYLQSRYYNPEWGRFINADALVGTPGELLSCNMFAYCKNNPINLMDIDGRNPFAAILVWGAAAVEAAVYTVVTYVAAVATHLLVSAAMDWINSKSTSDTPSRDIGGGATYAEKKEVTDAGTPNSKSWNDAKKKIKEGKGKGVNVKARNESEAERLINEARPNLDKRPTYEAKPPRLGYEKHPIDNDYGMPHIKWRDWSKGKADGADGHIFWDI